MREEKKAREYIDLWYPPREGCVPDDDDDDDEDDDDVKIEDFYKF